MPGSFLDSLIGSPGEDVTGLKPSPKCIFIHIPKCAGTTIKENFRLHGAPWTHNNVTHIIDGDTKKFNSVEKFLKYNPFTIVRNPFDRMVSWFFYHKSLSVEELGSGPGRPASALYATSFEDWVMNNCPHHWDYSGRGVPQYVWRQLNWIEYTWPYPDRWRTEVVIPKANIIRYEELETVIPQLKNSSHRFEKKSERGDYKQYYTSSKIIDIVTELCKDDLEYFNYSFD